MFSQKGLGGTTGYEYTISTASATPTTGTGITTTSFTATTLAPDTLYYVFVRDSCGPNNFSAWDTLSFSTQPTGIATINGNFNVDAYPNPAKDLITVSDIRSDGIE